MASKIPNTLKIDLFADHHNFSSLLPLFICILTSRSFVHLYSVFFIIHSYSSSFHSFVFSLFICPLYSFVFSLFICLLSSFSFPFVFFSLFSTCPSPKNRTPPSWRCFRTRRSLSCRSHSGYSSITATAENVRKFGHHTHFHCCSHLSTHRRCSHFYISVMMSYNVHVAKRRTNSSRSSQQFSLKS